MGRADLTVGGARAFFSKSAKGAFCNDERAGRNYHVIMQIAYALWQVCATGVLSRLSDGRRKMAQVAWAKVISTALHMIGFAAIPKPAVGAMRMRRFHLSAG